MANSPVDTCTDMLRSGYPGLVVLSPEEDRAEWVVREAAQRAGRAVYTWSISTGIIPGLPGAKAVQVKAVDALLDARRIPEKSVLVCKDLAGQLDDPVVRRLVLDLIGAFRKTARTLIISTDAVQLPGSLERSFALIEVTPPDMAELRALVNTTIASLADRAGYTAPANESEIEAITAAASGLSLFEAENVFARSIVSCGRLDPSVIRTEKEQVVKKSGVLEYVSHVEGFDQVGGLDTLADWLRKRARLFTDESLHHLGITPRGVLLIGVQGCGKSLAARSVGTLWNLPVLRLDVGRVFTGLVGGSEKNMRLAIQTAEAVAPCILWIDEIEKGFSGSQSSGVSDGGTTARVFARFITWLQDKRKPVYVVGTANDVSQLPPEMLRKGRFDEIFFIDLPNPRERQSVFRIHLKKRQIDPAKYDLAALSEASDGFSGAEIEQALNEAVINALNKGGRSGRRRNPTTADILHELASTVPLSVTMREDIAELRAWARGRARPATAPLSDAQPDPPVS